MVRFCLTRKAFTGQFVMKYIKCFTLFLFAMTIGACSSVYDTKISYDKNGAIDTSKYQTFAWLNQNKILVPSKDLNPVMQLRVEGYIEQAFIEKGYRLIDDAEAADFTISYTVGSRDKISVNSYPAPYGAGMNVGWGRGYYGGYYGYGGYANETSVKTYTEGSLAIDIYDVSSRQPAWHGSGRKNISSEDKDDPGLAIKTMVDNVVGQFK